jgi:hypothetical protein
MLAGPISKRFVIGSAACRSSVLTRPSQNRVLLQSAFKIAGGVALTAAATDTY